MRDRLPISLLFVVALTIVRASLPAVPLPHPWPRIFVDAIAGAAASWAALQFGRDDAPRRAWSLVAATSWLLGLAHLCEGLIADPALKVPIARLFIVAANVCWPLAFAVFARNLGVGLGPLREGGGHVLTWALGLPALVLAAWVGCIGVAEKLVVHEATLNSGIMALSDAFIMFADATVFVATIHMLTTAASMLDGPLIRAYLLLCLSAISSLGAEVLTVLHPYFDLPALTLLRQGCGALAWATVVVAAIVQAMTLRSLRGRLRAVGR